MEKYGIFHRYEYYSQSGLTWTKWFREMFSSISDSEEELKYELKRCKNLSKEISKKMKRGDEFKIEKFEYAQLTEEDLKPKKRGRKKKTEN